jgi:hypothetical protein
LSYTIAQGKFPKKPTDSSVLEVCKKDFRKFKDMGESKVAEFLYERIVPFTQVINDPKMVFTQKENLEKIRKLIKLGREDVAFSMFFRTFPTCLPHR